MTTQTRRVTEQPLNLVLRPDSPAEAAYRSAVLAPGFEPAPGLALEYLGGKTLPSARLHDSSTSGAGRPRSDDDARPRARRARCATPDLNDDPRAVLPGRTVSATFAGSERPPRRRARAGSTSGSSRRSSSELDRTERLTGSTSTRASASAAARRRARRAATGRRRSRARARRLPRVDPHLRGTQARPCTTRSPSTPRARTGSSRSTQPWKNVCATLYHELQEVRTDPDVEDAIRAGAHPARRTCSAGTRRTAARSATSRSRRRTATSSS